jgi:hypothetical protein
MLTIGTVSSTAKPGGTITVRLPNGKTVSARAATEINTTQVVVYRDENSGTYYCHSGTTNQSIQSNRRITRVAPKKTPQLTYPIKVLFSIEFDDRFEFYIGGDRFAPKKIWELEKINQYSDGVILSSRTKIISAAINSTGNKLNDWIVMIQYSSPDLEIVVPGEYSLSGSYTVTDRDELEASVILQNGIAPIIHVGANGVDPIGNKHFAPRNPYSWYFFKDLGDLATGEEDREYLFTSERNTRTTLTTGDYAPEQLAPHRPFRYDESFQGLTTNSYANILLYDYFNNYLDYGAQVGSVTNFSYLDAVYAGLTGRLNVEGSVLISNVLAPSEDADSLLFPLYWDEVRVLDHSSMSNTLDVIAVGFHDAIMGGSLTLPASNLESGNYIAEVPGANQAFDLSSLRVLNIYRRGLGTATNYFSTETYTWVFETGLYHHKHPNIKNEATLNCTGTFSPANTEYSFLMSSQKAIGGDFNYVVVNDSGIQRISIPYEETKTTYRRSYDNIYIFGAGVTNTAIAKKVSTTGNIEVMGVSFGVNINKTLLAVAAPIFSDANWLYSGSGEAIKQRGLDNSAIAHRVEYGWEAARTGVSNQTVTFPSEPTFSETSFYYKNGTRYPLTTSNQDFRQSVTFYVDIPQKQELNLGFNIVNCSGFRIIPLFNAEDILENDKISRVAWSYDDGQDLKQKDVRLDVKTYTITVDNGIATIPDSSKIKAFKVKKISPALNQLDPENIDVIIHSMSCYFN